MRYSRLASIATGTALAATLGACGYNPTLPPSGPVGSYPSSYPSAYPATSPAYREFGRVTNIEYFQGTAPGASGPSVPGAIIGAVAGAVIGNQVGRSMGGVSTRDKGTVLGGVGGAVIGSQAGRTGTAGTNPVYRVTVQTDQGAMRAFDVPATGELRIGDRVRVENGVIYRG